MVHFLMRGGGGGVVEGWVWIGWVVLELGSCEGWRGVAGWWKKAGAEGGSGIGMSTEGWGMKGSR